MADGSTVGGLADQVAGARRLKDGVVAGHHLVARCRAPRCQRCAPCDPAPWLSQGLGELPLSALSERLRCVCGCRQADLEIWPGPGAQLAHPDLLIFR